jgi:Na+-driven multidrug efflux pump
LWLIFIYSFYSTAPVSIATTAYQDRLWRDRVGIQTTAAGALRGLQDTRIPMLLSFLAFWVIGLSSGCVLGFVFNFGAIGLWVGQPLGVAVSALVFVWRLHQLMSKLSY